jgi:hypothetical protein
MLLEAGFRDVRVVEQTTFDLGAGEADDFARSIAGALSVPPESVRDAADAIASVRIFGTKPAA